MSTTRNRLVAPRNVVNTKMLYSFYILKELSKGEVIKYLKHLEMYFKPLIYLFLYHQALFMKHFMI